MLPAALTSPFEAPAAPVPHAARRLLLVDDESMVARAIARMLSDREVVVTYGGAEALGLLDSDDAFDAILCDVMMPGVDGPALAEALAQSHPALRAKMVFITGGAVTPAAQSFLDRDDVVWLPKPIDRARLFAELARVTGAGLLPVADARA